MGEKPDTPDKRSRAKGTSFVLSDDEMHLLRMVAAVRANTGGKASISSVLSSLIAEARPKLEHELQQTGLIGNKG